MAPSVFIKEIVKQPLGLYYDLNLYYSLNSIPWDLNTASRPSVIA